MIDAFTKNQQRRTRFGSWGHSAHHVSDGDGAGAATGPAQRRHPVEELVVPHACGPRSTPPEFRRVAACFAARGQGARARTGLCEGVDYARDDAGGEPGGRPIPWFQGSGPLLRSPAPISMRYARGYCAR